MKRSSWLCGLAVIAAWGCTELEEPQIENDSVEIFVPRDSLRTAIATQLFYWYDVEGAARYELQIVTPSFDRIDQLVLDTNITGNKFEFTLQPGTYEWSVRAYNFTSSTGYTVHTLFIDSTSSLEDQDLVLVRPSDKDTSNKDMKILQWQGLYNADGYDVEIWQPDFSGQLLDSRSTVSDSAHWRAGGEGNYKWRIQAVNSQSHTPWASRSFFIDTTKPAPPLLQSPPQGQFFNSVPIDFEWKRGFNDGSSLSDTFYLANDSNFIQIRRRIYSQDLEATIDTLSKGIYYWGVRSFDKAGNHGHWSETRQFTLQ